VQVADTAERVTTDRARLIILITLAISVATLLLTSWRVRRSIVRPINETVDILRAVAERNYSMTLDETGSDEVATMRRALGTVLLDVRESMCTVRDSAQRMEQSSAKLSGISQDVDASSRDTGSQVGTVALASEQVSAGVRSALIGADQMSSAIREIADNAGRATQVAGEAVRTTTVTTEAMSKLTDSTAKISSVVSLITSIAEQTNLLALNATIEAARAGESGKGFAVVASEVKELAQSTGRATDDISKLIDTIQSDTGMAVSAIEQISRVVGEIHDYQAAIAGAVEEQTATTSEMVHAFSEAQASSEAIATSIDGVTRTTLRTAEGAQSTQEAAQELSGLANELNALVSRFQLT